MGISIPGHIREWKRVEEVGRGRKKEEERGIIM
jgi:hypothetical protein